VGKNQAVTFDPYAPYGPVIETTCRLVTWNVWGRYGDWSTRLKSIIAELRAAAPDVVCLQESWVTDDTTQGESVASALGYSHHLSVGDWEQDGWKSGMAICARWPIGHHEVRRLAGAKGVALYALIDGPRGPLQVFTVMLDYPLSASEVRQQQVSELLHFVDEVTSNRHATVLCGDFNAGPDSDEVRLLTGRSKPPVEGLVFYDAWEMAGGPAPGHTWSNTNPLAALSLFPDRRFDYILSAWPRRHGVGHPTQCTLLGVREADEEQLSDHYGVQADLRY
jgi:endonuclease/exonuclease/phosphatase family metal-dependent hydrolase